MSKNESVYKELTPPETVAELDRYIIAQDEAKKSVAIALRNRWRRMQVKGDIREEITPKNILMMGPTGVGKTEVSRRLAKLVNAPFVKVEATKFTEVGYVGRDVESIIRDLAASAWQIVKAEEQIKVREQAEGIAEERIMDLLLPGSRDFDVIDFSDPEAASISEQLKVVSEGEDLSYKETTRERLLKKLKAGELEDRYIEFETEKTIQTQMQILGPQGVGEIEGQIKDMFTNMIPKQKDKRKLQIKEARKYIIEEEQDNLLDEAKMAEMAVKRAEETGLVFLDEVDKICGSHSSKSPDVSREGVQRDLLPLVEGTTVSTKYGTVRTDYILFIASGAFHNSKPSDLMPEFQGRFPVRVEFESLTAEHFVRILKEPKSALVKQYKALLETEGVNVEFSDDAIQELAKLTAAVNSKTENIGARRLYTLMERLLRDLSFDAHDRDGEVFKIDKNYVLEKLKDIATDSDLSRYIL